MPVKQLVQIPMFAIIVAVQEYLLTPFPNIQATMLLMLLIASQVNLWNSILIVFVYVILDNLAYGLTPYILPQMLAWGGVVILTKFVKLSKDTPLLLAALWTIPMTLVFSLPFTILHFILYNTIWTYIIADIPFVLIMMLSSFISVLWLYKPLSNVLEGCL